MAYAAVGGVVVVIIMAAFFFLGSGGDHGTPAPQGTVTVTTTNAGGSASPGSKPSGTSVVPGSKVTRLPTPVPTSDSDGALVKVSYLGGFSGSYGVNGVMTKVQNSGERTYLFNSTNGTFSAGFQKDDGSAHELTVEIWNNGKAAKTGKTSAAHGFVNLSYTV